MPLPRWLQFLSPTPPLPPEFEGKTAYDFTFFDGQDAPLPLSAYQGKALLIVNTASRCGFTPQYGGLQALWQEYKDKGLVVLGVPCNDFGNQEPASNREIKQLCYRNYGVEFPLSRKEQVKGAYAHPFYIWARAVLGGAKAPMWNFHKYLIDRQGNLVDCYLPFTKPTSARLRCAVELALRPETPSS